MALNNAARLLPAVIDLVQQAGTRLAAEWQRPGGPRGVGDKAAIDLEIETFLRPRLLTLLAADFWGEETGQALNEEALCWVVDPNDGTADFLNGIAGSAIEVGLLQDALPVPGGYAPVTVRGPDCTGGAEGLPGLLRNGRRLQLDLSGQTLNPHGLVMVSAAARGKPQLNASGCAPADFDAMPRIAYRLARVAAGDGVCGVSRLGARCGRRGCVVAVLGGRAAGRGGRTDSLCYRGRSGYRIAALFWWRAVGVPRAVRSPLAVVLGLSHPRPR